MCNKLICFTTLISWIISRVTTNVNLAYNTESAEILSNLRQHAHMHTQRDIVHKHTHAHTRTFLQQLKQWKDEQDSN